MVSSEGSRAPARLRVGAVLGLGAVLVAAPLASAQGKRALPPLPKVATTSSPIALSPDGKTVWVVNPDANNVSVIRTDTNRVIRNISTDRDPRAVAIEPRGKFAYVANPEDNSVTVIQIQNPDPKRFRARRVKDLVTGAEPWNVVASPDGKRVFVSNSGQDTVTVINTATNRIIGSVNIGDSICNDPDRTRHFQPRGLAVTGNSRLLYVTSFFAFTKAGGRQATDTGRAGAVCQVRINTSATAIGGYRAARRVSLEPQLTGFNIDSTGDGVADPTSAFPNQLQSIVIRGNQAYLPNIAASPSGPLRFNVDTQAFVSVIDGVNGGSPSDAGSAKFLNLHLGARNPEAGKDKLFFANVWAVGFAKRGSTENAYVVSAGSDLLVKLKVNRASGKLDFTVDQDTTRYIDLNDPDRAAGGAACRTGKGLVPARAGCSGKNPQGIAINKQGTRAYVFNYVSRNVSVVNLVNDTVLGTIRTQALPPVGTSDETVQVGAEVFFSSRGKFDRPAGATVSTNDRLSSEGWQSCASCHFEGLTDSVVWAFGAGPRKSVPLNATFNPKNPTEQRVLNYSAIFDEVEDFEANIRNVSGPGALATAQTCATAPAPSTGVLDPNHGLLIGDDGNVNVAPCVLNSFALSNTNRRQLTVTLPGSSVQVPALTAMREWVRLAVRTPNSSIPAAPGRPGTPLSQVNDGRNLFVTAGCQSCHSGGKWTISTKNFISPPATADVATELLVAPATPSPGNDPIGTQYLPAFLRDIGSFNIGTIANPLGNNVGAEEKASAALTLVNGNLTSGVPKDALGKDYNADGKGNGYNVPSVLGLLSLPPYYHNGACESLACVVGNVKHRTVNGTRPDGLVNPSDQAKVVAFLESIDATTNPLP